MSNELITSDEMFDKLIAQALGEVISRNAQVVFEKYKDAPEPELSENFYKKMELLIPNVRELHK